jgi:predicted MPP superfamily phosphohydrolase
LGFRLLRNESIQIQKGNSSIDLIGVENWGKGFAQYGDLNKATANLEEKSFKILMSHDPSHFDEVVKKFSQLIHLTLSGHTHGMQFGIEIPGFIRWSPASLRYPKWAGLYEELGRYLHVNRGFGFLAFPGRVGIWPEITVLELRRK